MYRNITVLSNGNRGRSIVLQNKQTNRLTERSVLCLQEAGAGWGEGELDESSEEPDLQLRDHILEAQGTM